MKIEPEKQFVATPKLIAEIVSQYGMECISYDEASTGIENSTIIASTDKGKFVVRVYRLGKKSPEEINLEVDFVNYLRENSVKVPIILQNKSNSHVTTLVIGSVVWHAIVMEYVEGVHAEEYARELLDELATTQASMHKLAASYKNANSERADTLDLLQETFFIKQIKPKNINSQQVIEFLERAKKYKVSLDSSLPRGLCHLDYDKENALAIDGSLTTVLDFDDLQNAPYVVCLSYTLWHIKSKAGNEAAEHYLAKYQSVRKLTDLELSYVRPVMLFRHYVISSIKILNNRITSEDISRYLSIEAELLAE